MKRRVYTMVLETADHDADLLDNEKVFHMLENRFDGTAIHFMGIIVDEDQTKRANRSRACDHDICERIGAPGVFTPTDDELEVIVSCGVARGIIDPKKVDAVKYILKEWTK